MSTTAIEILWREYLCAYAEPRIKATLQRHWGADPNIVQERIQFAYPPTFQPGYVGTRFVESRTKILFIGYNPGEGKLQSSQEDVSASYKVERVAVQHCDTQCVFDTAII